MEELKSCEVADFPESGLKKTRPFRFLLLNTVVLDWFLVSSCLSRWSLTCQTLAVNAKNRTKTTKFKSDILETPVILMPDRSPQILNNSNKVKSRSKVGLLEIRKVGQKYVKSRSNIGKNKLLCRKTYF